jgi:hypothetical protein
MARRKITPMRRMKTDAEGAPAKRWDENAVRIRRQEVFELHFMQGLEIGTIAEMEGVHRGTISSDVKLLRQELAQELRKADVVEEVALAAAKYERLAQMALYEATQARSEVGKSKLLALAHRSYESKNNFLMSTGVLPSRRSQIDLRVHGAIADAEIDGAQSFSELLEDPLRRRQASSFVERLLGANPAMLNVDTGEENVINLDNPQEG